LARYAAGLTLAHTLAAAEVVLVVLSLARGTGSGIHALLSLKNLFTVVGLVVLGSVMASVGAAVYVAPAVRWYVTGQEPDERQSRVPTLIVERQSMIELASWALGGAVFLAVNHAAGPDALLLIGLSALFGGAAATCMGYLITFRTLRPVIAMAMQSSDTGPRLPGVRARLLITWLLCSAMPCGAIALLILLHVNGWVIEKALSVEMPALVLSMVALLLGLRAISVVSRSISEPVREVVDAMAAVGCGDTDRFVDVYESSDIGHLQRGFNRMVAGLAERELLRDLFGRHVGVDVARRALAGTTTADGEVRDVAVLFVDLAGSTQLAASRPPAEVAGLLNEFFRIVVAEVDRCGGLINKFEGDAVLAVFGVPLHTDGWADAALRTARALGHELPQLADLDFGVGVSAGPVFAGNIGAENRYEYTVIGDPVNEAARLADQAKNCPTRIMASGAVIAAAGLDEAQRWQHRGPLHLRGRPTATQVFEPRNVTYYSLRDAGSDARRQN
jgi:class 3 adenylate cyclase